MSLPNSILFPIDFSDHCRLVWPAVSDMARHLGAPITLLHALDIDYRNDLVGADLKEIRERVKLKLELFPGAELNVPSVRREIAEGPASECIVQYASKMEAPLIMMPTRGHTRFRQLLLGSVTAAVLHDAICPVWTEAHTEDGSTGRGVPHSVVCAIDMGTHTSRILRTASEFNSKFGSVLHVVHSVPGIDPRFPSGAASRAHRFLVEDAQRDFLNHCSRAGVETPLEVVEDVGLVDAVVCTVDRHQADLLVIGRGVIQGPLGRLRTNAHELIRRSPCPVLSV
jgi:nucleotide-binding universal stress UspA family protein